MLTILNWATGSRVYFFHRGPKITITVHVQKNITSSVPKQSGLQRLPEGRAPEAWDLIIIFVLPHKMQVFWAYWAQNRQSYSLQVPWQKSMNKEIHRFTAPNTGRKYSDHPAWSLAHTSYGIYPKSWVHAWLFLKKIPCHRLNQLPLR